MGDQGVGEDPSPDDAIRTPDRLPMDIPCPEARESVVADASVLIGPAVGPVGVDATVVTGAAVGLVVALGAGSDRPGVAAAAVAG